MRIPFTNFDINFNRAEAGSKFPKAYARKVSSDPSRDTKGFKISYDSLFTIYRNHGDVFGCVREWEQNLGSAGYRWANPTNPDEEVSDQTKRDLDMIMNYEKPWQFTKARIVRHLGISGNAFVFIVRNALGNKVLGLQPIDPRTISIVATKSGEIVKYIQRVKTYDEPIIFEPEEIIHFQLGIDPNYELMGLSPLEPVVWDARTDLSAMFSNFSFFRNDARPAVMYILDENMSAEEQKNAIEQLEKQFKGVHNRSKAGVLSGVKEVKELSISQKDMEFLSGRRFATEKICAAYGVPKFLLGYTETVNNNNGVELTKNFHNGTIRPIEMLIEQTLTNQFLNRIGLEGQVEFAFVPVDLEARSDKEVRALEMLRSGAITLRQFKMMLEMEITDEDESNPNFDQYVIHQGQGASLLEDVGTNPFVFEDDPAQQNAVAA